MTTFARFTPECEHCRSVDLEWYSGKNYLCLECGGLTGIDDEDFLDEEE